MEIASAMHLPEFVSSANEFINHNGIEDTTTLFGELPVDYFDGLDFPSLVSDSSYDQNHDSKRKQNPPAIIGPSPALPRPSKLQAMKTNNNESDISSRLISFEHSNYNTHHFPNMKLKSLDDEKVLHFSSLNERLTNMPGNVTRNPVQAQDHVLAERRRREKLNQKFIALSSIIPGLKKMDKASVLGDAIEYVKQLKEREKILEEQVAKKRKESAALTRRSFLFANNDNPPASDDVSEQAPAEIEARVLGKEALIRIQCEKERGCEAKVLRELENLGLTVRSSSILPFGETTRCVTMIAQMEEDSNVTANNLVGSLRKALY